MRRYLFVICFCISFYGCEFFAKESIIDFHIKNESNKNIESMFICDEYIMGRVDKLAEIGRLDIGQSVCYEFNFTKVHFELRGEGIFSVQYKLEGEEFFRYAFFDLRLNLVPINFTGPTRMEKGLIRHTEHHIMITGEENIVK